MLAALISPILCALALFVLYSPQSAFASDFSQQVSKHTSELVDSTFDRQGLVILNIGLILAATQSQNDEKSQAWWGGREFGVSKSLLEVGEFFGTGVPSLAIVGAQYYFGKKAAAWAHLEAALLASTFTHVVKRVAQRRRPDGGKFSFPSGHTTIAFVTATNVYYSVGWRWSVPLYAVATLTALQRMQARRHWLSDTIMGGTIGILIARGTAGLWLKENHFEPIVLNGGESLGLGWRYEY